MPKHKEAQSGPVARKAVAAVVTAAARHMSDGLLRWASSHAHEDSFRRETWLGFGEGGRRKIWGRRVGFLEPPHLAKLPSVAAEPTSNDMRMRAFSKLSGGMTAKFPVLLFFGMPRGKVRASDSPLRLG